MPTGCNRSINDEGLTARKDHLDSIHGLEAAQAEVCHRTRVGSKTRTALRPVGPYLVVGMNLDASGLRCGDAHPSVLSAPLGQEELEVVKYGGDQEIEDSVVVEISSDRSAKGALSSQSGLHADIDECVAVEGEYLD